MIQIKHATREKTTVIMVWQRFLRRLSYRINHEVAQALLSNGLDLVFAFILQYTC